MGGSRAQPHLSSQHSYSNARAHACATSLKCPTDVLILFFCNRQVVRTRSRVTRASIHVEVFFFYFCHVYVILHCQILILNMTKASRSDVCRSNPSKGWGDSDCSKQFFSTLVFIWCHRVRGYPRLPAVQIIRLRAEMMKIWEAASRLRIRQIRITLNTETCKAAPAE